VNAAVRIAAPARPEALLATLHRIEAAFGRTRDRRWGPRTLDLDLLACGGLILPDAATLRHWIDLPPDRQQTEAPDRLLLPHPRLQDRAFVLVPLGDIAPDWRHPLTGRTAAGMLAALPPAARAALRPLD
jgi:2-amino-4-hydroxy-6-hydroxymethyldihydropteridine diphosphokinase